MDNSKQQDDSYVLILLGWDILYSLDLNRLKSDQKAELKLVFSHHNKQPDQSDYPLGMGLFVTNGGSKLHFFGGENLVDCQRGHVDDINHDDIGLLNKRPDRDSLPPNEDINVYHRINLSADCIDKWFNKKCFSFSLSFNHLDNNSNRRLCITPANTSPKLPNHVGYKVRPIVVTMLSKLYVLTTRPYAAYLPADYGIRRDHILFEAFDPYNGEWEKLDAPPAELCDAIVGKGYFSNLTISHCVHKEKLLLQTCAGQYLFNANSKLWSMPEYSCPIILATLVYKEFLLAFVLFGTSNEFVVYDLEKFDLGTFWKESANYISALDILEDKEYCFISHVSFSLLKNNQICAVINDMGKLHVYLFEIKIMPTYPEHLRYVSSGYNYHLRHSNSGYNYHLRAHVHAHQMFARPPLLHDASIVTTFLFPEPREENAEGSNRGKSNTVFLKGLPSSVTTFAIKKRFQILEFGEIKPNGVFLNCEEHFAFVEFEDVESIDKATKASPIRFGGKYVYIDKVNDAGQSRKLWWSKQKAFKVSRNGRNCPS